MHVDGKESERTMSDEIIYLLGWTGMYAPLALGAIGPPAEEAEDRPHDEEDDILVVRDHDRSDKTDHHPRGGGAGEGKLNCNSG